MKGPKISVPICELVDAILYKLKTGVKWDMLPVCSLFSSKPLHYKTVFGHYRKWCESGAWKDCWIGLVGQNKEMLDLSSVDLDGSHTTALWGRAVKF
ncbi:MAG: transposase [Flammeovirgaceae bacterium]